MECPVCRSEWGMRAGWCGGICPDCWNGLTEEQKDFVHEKVKRFMLSEDTKIWNQAYHCIGAEVKDGQITLFDAAECRTMAVLQGRLDAARFIAGLRRTPMSFEPFRPNLSQKYGLEYL